MSRRPAGNAAQNQQVIKNLLKLEANKNCADCKRNKHPRWASWNLGVFICIRCSGIHRGMGTHISRVKSVDLDAWTDEQLQKIMKWGNARANRYWESKLAPGHIPSEAKIENFIRTKYESKRWVMDGQMPDPSTLGGDGDEDVPLTTVQEKARLDRSSSQRVTSTPAASQARRAQAAPSGASVNLIDGGDDFAVPPRASTTEPPTTARAPPPPAASAAQPSQLLGGLDFLGGPSQRPASTSSGPASMSRPDLKQSILSLYASKPAAQAPSQAPGHSRQESVGLNAGSGGNDAFGGLNDAFKTLSFPSGPTSASNPKPQASLPSAAKPAFSNAPKAQPAKPDAYAALSGVLLSPRQSETSPPATSAPLAGGGFFDPGSKAPAKAAPPAAKPASNTLLATQSATDDWGDFSFANDSSASTAAPAATSAPKPPSAEKSVALLDFTGGAAANFSPPPTVQSHSRTDSSVFNLSAKPQSSVPVNNMNSAPAPAPSSFAANPWGPNEWSTPDPAPATLSTATAKSTTTAPAATGSSNNTWSAPDDWMSSSNQATSASKPAPVMDMGGWGDPTPTSTSAGGFGGFGGSTATPAAPKVQPEEDFNGGWGAPDPAPARPEAQRQQSQTQSSAGGATGAGMASNSDDLFANVWG